MVLICSMGVMLSATPALGITLLYTREIPDELHLVVPALISVWQDPDTGNIISNRLGETRVLITKNVPQGSEKTEETVPEEKTPSPPVPAEITPESPPPHKLNQPIPEEKKPKGWVALGKGLVSGIDGEYFINEQSIRSLNIADNQYIYYRSQYLINETDAYRVNRIIQTVTRFIIDQGETIPNTTPFNVNGTLWIVSLTENDRNWSVESIQEDILADPTNSRCLIQKRYYYATNQKLIAVAILSDTPRQQDEIALKPWTTISVNTPLYRMLEYAQKFLSL